MREGGNGEPLILRSDGTAAATLDPGLLDGKSREAAAAGRRETLRQRAALMGVNRLGRAFMGAQVIALFTSILMFAASGLSLDWGTAVVGLLQTGILLVVWLNFLFVPGRTHERFVAEVVFVTLLLVLLTNVMSPMQYGAIALGFPYVDSWLAAGDAAIGVHVPALVAWTMSHPHFSQVLTVAYFSLLPQFFFTVIVLAVLRERVRLWEFAFHFHVCLIVTVAALVVWPAMCAPVFYHFDPTIDIARPIEQIQRLHAGTMQIVRFDELEGLVSVPSFHAAGALLTTWAFRRRRRILIPLIVLNSALIAATFMTGLHYVVDVLASVPLCAFSVVAWRLWGRSRLGARSDGANQNSQLTA
jgi:hypothetical protein